MDKNSVLYTLYSGKVVVATIPPSNGQFYAWVGIYPLDLSRPSTISFLRNQGISFEKKSGRAYHIRKFEVKKELVDEDISIAEPEMTNKVSYFVFGDDELLSTLVELNVAVDQFDLPHTSNYPI